MNQIDHRTIDSYVRNLISKEMGEKDNDNVDNPQHPGDKDQHESSGSRKSSGLVSKIDHRGTGRSS